MKPEGKQEEAQWKREREKGRELGGISSPSPAGSSLSSSPLPSPFIVGFLPHLLQFAAPLAFFHIIESKYPNKSSLINSSFSFRINQFK
jgi:hypothetical protein